MATDATERPEVQDRYYYESATEDGEILTFEAGAVVGGEEYYVEGRKLAACQHPRPAPYARRSLDRMTNCENPAIAMIVFAGGDEMKVCREHYDDIRGGFKARADDTEEAQP